MVNEQAVFLPSPLAAAEAAVTASWRFEGAWVGRWWTATTSIPFEAGFPAAEFSRDPSTWRLVAFASAREGIESLRFTLRLAGCVLVDDMFCFFWFGRWCEFKGKEKGKLRKKGRKKPLELFFFFFSFFLLLSVLPLSAVIFRGEPPKTHTPEV